MAAVVKDLFVTAFNGYERAPYEVTQKFDNGVEERRYPKRKWITIESPMKKGDSERKKASSNMFFALFGYITGKNEKSQSISMTVPVATKIVESSEAERSCQMGFFIPNQFQENTPEPSDTRVKIVERDLHVYAITFGGYLTDETEKANLDKLLEFLKSKSIEVPKDPETQKPIHYAVGYDAPYKFWNRTNDIWVVVE